MIEVGIWLDDEGWGVGYDVVEPDEGEVGGCEFGSRFARFEDAMTVALEEIEKHGDGSCIYITGGVAKAALRDRERAGTSP